MIFRVCVCLLPLPFFSSKHYPSAKSSELDVGNCGMRAHFCLRQSSLLACFLADSSRPLGSSVPKFGMGIFLCLCSYEASNEKASVSPLWSASCPSECCKTTSSPSCVFNFGQFLFGICFGAGLARTLRDAGVRPPYDQ